MSSKLIEILNGLHPTYQTAKLKALCLREGVFENQCKECGVKDTYNGKPLVMHLDHINGKSDDHRLVNLRMLCPNCHSQTSTYSGRNKQNSSRTLLADKLAARRKLVLEQEDAKYKKRVADLTEVWNQPGAVTTLSKRWRVTHTSVRKFINKFIASQNNNAL